MTFSGKLILLKVAYDPHKDEAKWVNSKEIVSERISCHSTSEVLQHLRRSRRWWELEDTALWAKVPSSSPGPESPWPQWLVIVYSSEMESCEEIWETFKRVNYKKQTTVAAGDSCLWPTTWLKCKRWGEFSGCFIGYLLSICGGLYIRTLRWVRSHSALELPSDMKADRRVSNLPRDSKMWQLRLAGT